MDQPQRSDAVRELASEFGERVVHHQRHGRQSRKRILDLRRAPANVDRHDHAAGPGDRKIQFQIAILVQHQHAPRGRRRRCPSLAARRRSARPDRRPPPKCAADRRTCVATPPALICSARRNPCVTFMSPSGRRFAAIFPDCRDYLKAGIKRLATRRVPDGNKDIRGWAVCAGVIQSPPDALGIGNGHIISRGWCVWAPDQLNAKSLARPIGRNQPKQGSRWCLWASVSGWISQQ